MAAEHVIRAFCCGNPEGQSSLGATLMQVDDPGAMRLVMASSASQSQRCSATLQDCPSLHVQVALVLR